MSRLPPALAACLLACACGDPPARVALSDTEPAGAAASSARPLRIAISPMESPELSFEHYSELFALVGKKLGEPLELLQRQTYSEVVALVEHKRVDAALVCSGPFVQARRDFGAEILAVPRIAGTTTYRALIVVRQDSPARTLDDLRGKTFALTDPLSTSGMIFPAYLLRERGETTESFFGKVLFTKSHDNSIAAVADGLVDGASVSGLVFAEVERERPETVRGLRVIVRSPAFGNPPLIVHPAADRVLRGRLQSVLLLLHRDPQGRRLLSQMGIERFVLGDPAAYAEAQRMRERVRPRTGT